MLEHVDHTRVRVTRSLSCQACTPPLFQLSAITLKLCASLPKIHIPHPVHITGSPRCQEVELTVSQPASCLRQHHDQHQRVKAYLLGRSALKAGGIRSIPFGSLRSAASVRPCKRVAAAGRSTPHPQMPSPWDTSNLPCPSAPVTAAR